MKRLKIILPLLLMMAISIFVFSACPDDLLTVTFDSTGGTAVAPRTNIAYRARITAPADPSKDAQAGINDGFRFRHWSVSVDGAAFDFVITPITEDITLYAVWEVIPLSAYVFVTFDAGEALHAPAVQQVARGAHATAPMVNPSRADGYAFRHWSLTAGGAEFAFGTSPVTASITLYAVWRAPVVGTPTPPSGLTALIGQEVGDVAGLPAAWEWVTYTDTDVGPLGTNTFHARLRQTATHNPSAPVAVQVLVGRWEVYPNPTFPAAVRLVATYGDNLAQIANQLPEGWAWVAANPAVVYVGLPGDRVHQVRLVQTGTHYQSNPVNATVDVARLPFDGVAELPDGYYYDDFGDAIWGQTLADIADLLPAGWEWADDTQFVGAVGTRQHQIRIPATQTVAPSHTIDVYIEVGRAQRTITRADIPFGWSYNTFASAILGQTLADLTAQVPDGWEWVDAGASVGTLGAQPHQARMLQTATHYVSNYITVYVIVSRRPADMGVFEGLSFSVVHGQTHNAIIVRDADNEIVALPGNWSWAYPTQEVDRAVGGEQRFVLSFAQTDMYAGRTFTVDVVVNRAPNATPNAAFPAAHPQITAEWGQTLADIAYQLPAAWAWVNPNDFVGDSGHAPVMHQVWLYETVTHLASNPVGIGVLVGGVQIIQGTPASNGLDITIDNQNGEILISFVDDFDWHENFPHARQTGQGSDNYYYIGFRLLAPQSATHVTVPLIGLNNAPIAGNFVDVWLPIAQFNAAINRFFALPGYVWTLDAVFYAAGGAIDSQLSITIILKCFVELRDAALMRQTNAFEQKFLVSYAHLMGDPDFWQLITGARDEKTASIRHITGANRYTIISDASIAYFIESFDWQGWIDEVAARAFEGTWFMPPQGVYNPGGQWSNNNMITVAGSQVSLHFEWGGVTGTATFEGSILVIFTNHWWGTGEDRFLLTNGVLVWQGYTGTGGGFVGYVLSLPDGFQWHKRP